MQRFVTLSGAQAEYVAVTECVQDVLCMARDLLNGMGLRVKLPIILYMDNKGGVDTFYSWNKEVTHGQFPFVLHTSES
jgi:hypothetical protein